MATVPLSGTDIRLMTSVPFSNDYKNTRWFDTKTEQTNYFLAKPTTYSAGDHTFQRIEGRQFVKVKKHIDSLWGTNYMMFQNSDYGSRWFYAFVTKLEYMNESVTKVYFEIDVFQTWKFDMNFKPSYVVREHCKLWNDDGTPVINTIDEGLNYGTEYETVYVNNYKPTDDILFLVIVTKEAMHVTPRIEPTFNGMPQPLSYYVHPFRLVGGEPIVQVNGQNAPPSTILETLKGIFSLTTAVNNVVSLYVTDYIGKYVSIGGGLVNFDSDSFQWVQIADSSNNPIYTYYVSNIQQYESITEPLGDKYSGYKPVTESKLLMYPYTVTLLDDMKGNRVEIKNEYIKSPNLTLRIKGSLGTSNKVSYAIDDYLTDSTLSFESKLKLSLEKAIINNNPNDISILNDFLSSYLQGNRNTIENQKIATVWGGVTSALTGGAVGTAQSMFNVGTGGGGRAWMMNPVGMVGAGLQVATGVGDAVIGIQGINAKIKDIDNTPAQLVKMGGNTAFDYGNGNFGVFVIKKQITEEYRKKLTDFFNMFGYKVNEVKVPNFHTRQNWNYVQTENCTILGNLNNEDLIELKKVFDGGITLWHTDDVGNYALENGVI